MACGDYGGDLLGAVTSGAAQDFVTCAYISSIDGGAVLWPLFIVGTVVAGAFAATRSAVPPVILMLLLGPFVVATLPGAASNLLATASIFTIPAVLFLLFIRFKTARP